MSKYVLHVHVDLDDMGAENHRVLDRILEIAESVKEHIEELYSADNPTSDEMPFRYDGLEPPFVRGNVRVNAIPKIAEVAAEPTG